MFCLRYRIAPLPKNCCWMMKTRSFYHGLFQGPGTHLFCFAARYTRFLGFLDRTQHCTIERHFVLLVRQTDLPLLSNDTVRSANHLPRSYTCFCILYPYTTVPSILNPLRVAWKAFPLHPYTSGQTASRHDKEATTKLPQHTPSIAYGRSQSLPIMRDHSQCGEHGLQTRKSPTAESTPRNFLAPVWPSVGLPASPSPLSLLNSWKIPLYSNQTRPRYRWHGWARWAKKRTQNFLH